jgi:hypothetical protein
VRRFISAASAPESVIDNGILVLSPGAGDARPADRARGVKKGAAR